MPLWITTVTRFAGLPIPPNATVNTLEMQIQYWEEVAGGCLFTYGKRGVGNLYAHSG